MGLLDSVKSFFGVESDGADDYIEDETEETVSDTDGYEKPSSKKNRETRILNVNPTTQLEVVLVKPERFEDASGIADHLNSKRTVVLNLESTSKEV